MTMKTLPQISELRGWAAVLTALALAASAAAQVAIMQQGKVDLILKEAGKLHQSADQLKQGQMSFDATTKTLMAEEQKFRDEASNETAGVAARQAAAARSLQKRTALVQHAHEHAGAATEKYRAMIGSLDSITTLVKDDPAMRGEPTPEMKALFTKMHASVAADQQLWHTLGAAVERGEVSAATRRNFAGAKALANQATEVTYQLSQKMKNLGFAENLSALREQMMQRLTHYAAVQESTGAQLQRIQVVALYNQIALAGQKVGQVLESILSGIDPLGLEHLKPGSELDYLVTVDPFADGSPGSQSTEPALTKEIFTSVPKNLPSLTP